ncbi:tRNA pseudouridine(13) synthase TruD [Marinobacteraceae bacterium S3BR75-40.1]
MNPWRLTWPAAWGGPVGSAQMRTSNEDFRVEELLPAPLEGQGDHLCLYLQKSGDNTEYVARQLARIAGLKPVDIGFCGLKDRHAITAQWFSLHRPKGDDAALVEAVSEHWSVLEYRRHHRKLRRGEHRANRFTLVLRELALTDREALEQRLQAVRDQGFPNYFGPQRFGFDGNNLDQAIQLDPRKLRGRLGKRAMYLSAARAWLFNELLGERVANGTWLTRLDGDPDPAQPTAAMLGDGGSSAEPPLKEDENALLEAHPHFKELLACTRTRPERRPTVIVPEGFEWQWLDDDALELRFGLPTGSFATSLLEELLEVTTAPR